MGFIKKTISFKVTIHIEPDNDRFHAYCPVLKGLHVDGVTVEEALENAEDAVIAYLKSLVKHNESIPLGVELVESDSSHITPPPPIHTHIRQIPVTV